MRQKATIARNREIFAHYQAGQTTTQLAQTYGLNRHTVVAIIGLERHRLEVSTDVFYEEQRISLGLGGQPDLHGPGIVYATDPAVTLIKL